MKNKILNVSMAVACSVLVLTACGSKKTDNDVEQTAAPVVTAAPAQENEKITEAEDKPQDASKPKQPAEENKSGEKGDSKEPENKAVFMYFVTNSDLDNKTTKDALDKLKKEYGEKVTFDIKNVDEDKTLLENFSIVNGNMPALIMLNGEADITGFLPKTNDYNKLKESVEMALKN